VNFGNFLKKLQSQPEDIRKIIFWIIIIIVSLFLGFLWVKNFQTKLKHFQEQGFIEELSPPSFEEEFKSFPQPEVGESLKELEEIIEEAKTK